MPRARTELTIVRPDAKHRAAWDRLFAGYAEFYKVAQTQEMRDRVWNWITSPHHDVKAFIAVDASDTPIGLAHYRPFARPLHAATGGFLDDLFVDPACRGGGVAHALIAAVAEEGHRLGWSGLRWLTAENNYRARSVYDRFAVRPNLLLYDMPLTKNK